MFPANSNFYCTLVPPGPPFILLRWARPKSTSFITWNPHKTGWSLFVATLHSARNQRSTD